MADQYLATVTKDPDSVLDYTVNWASWLGSDTISSVTWTVSTGITNSATSNTTTLAVIWLAGGTAGSDYSVACKVVTAGGRTDERTFSVRVRER